MIKKLSLVVLLFSSYLSSFGQDPVLRAGTPIQLAAAKTVYARDVNEGDDVPFRVTMDVTENKQVLIPAGTMVTGKVTEARKSSIAGTKGRLKININSLRLPSGQQLVLNHDVAFYGQNRTPVAVVAALFVWPCIFIPGSKAYMPEGYITTAQVLSNTTIE